MLKVMELSPSLSPLAPPIRNEIWDQNVKGYITVDTTVFELSYFNFYQTGLPHSVRRSYCLLLTHKLGALNTEKVRNNPITSDSQIGHILPMKQTSADRMIEIHALVLPYLAVKLRVAALRQLFPLVKCCSTWHRHIISKPYWASLENIKRVTLGEGPHWDESTQTLYYVDIFGQAIHRYVPSTNTHTKVKLEGGPVTLVVPVDGSNDRFLASIGRKLVVVTWNGVSNKVSKVEKLVEVENEPEVINNRFNDGKADPIGRLWAGTMGPEPEIGKLEKEKGALYTLTGKHEVKTHLTKVSIANGLAWNVELKKMYYIDSPRRTVDQYDYNMEKGEICNRKVVFNLDHHEIPGVPDGMTIDTDGNLWVAVFDGGRILHINPITSELISTIDFPAKQITAAAFGGPNLDELYVTSAQLVVRGEKQPHPAGAVFKVTGTGARGFPGVKVKLPL